MTSACFLVARDDDESSTRNIVASASTVEQLWEVIADGGGDDDIYAAAKDAGMRLSIMVVDTDAAIVTETPVDMAVENNGDPGVQQAKVDDEEDAVVEINIEDVEQKLGHGNATFACESVPETSAMIDALESLGVPLEAMTIDVRITAANTTDANTVYARGITHIRKRIMDALKQHKTVRIGRPVLVSDTDPDIKTSTVFSLRRRRHTPPAAAAAANDVPVHVERPEGVQSDAAQGGGTPPQ